VLLGCVVSKAKLVMMYRWNAEKALELIERERVTNFVGVPTQSWDLVNSPRFAEFDTSAFAASVVAERRRLRRSSNASPEASRAAGRRWGTA
jgi:acyl-CoA synthetase (AMP-forming)/AMP-acid ligase II